jgi:DNA-binding HxlR family transcriptional regulator
MPLGTDYSQQDCSIARALELIGERWTLLILRDCFFGVRRFNDFLAHLDISRAVLTERLAGLTEAGILSRVPRGKRDDYVLTERGMSLWPALFALAQWGDQHTSAKPRRIFSHISCGSDILPAGTCPRCGTQPSPEELEMRPGPGSNRIREDDVSLALRHKRRLLEPIRAA